MSIYTYMFELTIDPENFRTTENMNSVKENVVSVLKQHLSDLKTQSFIEIDGGFLAVLLGPQGSFITIRGIKQGLVTINIEYYKPAVKPEMLYMEKLRLIELSMSESLGSSHSKHLPPIKRGAAIDVYFTTSDERLLEYDIDKVLFEERSPYQKVQILHSKTLGNLLVLDEVQNIAESDLIYTETLMQRGVENYENKEIIILGGGDGCLLWELLKENPKHVIMLELDEVVMRACKLYLRSSCGNCLDNLIGENYEIIVGDCFKTLDDFIDKKKKVDYVFGDLTDIPVDSSGKQKDTWDFIKLILNKSMQVLKPGGRFLGHGNGVSAAPGLQIYENLLKNLEIPVTFTKTSAYVPSFYEEWMFYQIKPIDQRVP